MSTPLPSTGPEREIFLRSLRAYREACEVPSLTPDCPFAQETGEPGRRWCNEECADLLAEYLAPPATPEISLGDDLMLYRRKLPRARRGPALTARPFDAVQMNREDREKPDMRTWRLPALLIELRTQLTWGRDSVDIPAGQVDSRSVRVQLLRDEIDQRGLDSEVIIRCGFGDPIISVLSTAAAMPTTGRESASATLSRAELWLPLFGLEPQQVDPEMPVDETAEIIGSRIYKTFAKRSDLRQWILAAPIEDVIEWEPPSSWSFDKGAEISEDERHVAVWMVDRFTETYVENWRWSSLKYEWAYLHGELVAPCAPHDMRVHSLTEEKLSRRIADVAVQRDGSMSQAPATRAGELTPFASKLLNDGRFVEAAAIFEAFVTANPHDAEALNNWAFCLMPKEPLRALTLFERAEAAGYGNELVLGGNRLLCLYRLERYTSALELAGRLLPTLRTWPASSNAYMWRIDDTRTGEDVHDVRQYVVDLIDQIVCAVDDSSVTDEWARILEELREQPAV